MRLRLWNIQDQLVHGDQKIVSIVYLKNISKREILQEGAGRWRCAEQQLHLVAPGVSPGTPKLDESFT